jgi:Flp pilus assembly protein TadD
MHWRGIQTLAFAVLAFFCLESMAQAITLGIKVVEDGPKGSRTVVVRQVQRGGVAARMGIQSGDTILFVNDARIGSLPGLRAALKDATVTVVWKSGEKYFRCTARETEWHFENPDPLVAANEPADNKDDRQPEQGVAAKDDAGLSTVFAGQRAGRAEANAATLNESETAKIEEIRSKPDQLATRQQADAAINAAAGKGLDDPERCRQAVWLLMDMHRRDEAAALAAKVAERHADRPELLMELAFVQRHAGRGDDAIATAKRAAEHDPDDVSILAELINVQDKAGKADEAFATAARAVQRHGDDPRLLAELLYMLSGISKFDAVVSEVCKAVKPKLGRPEFRSLVLYVLGLDRTGEAAELSREFAKLNARDPVTIAQTIRVRAQGSKTDEIRDLARKYLTVGTRTDDVIEQLATEMRRDGNLDSAIAVVQEVQSGQPQNVRLNLKLAGLLAEAGRGAEATSICLGLIERLRGNDSAVDSVRALLAWVYERTGQITKAEAELKALLRRTPDDPHINNSLGYIYADQGKELGEAEAMIRRALEARPQDRNYLDSLGWVLFKQGRNAEAITTLEKACSGGMEIDPDIYEHLGDAYVRSKRLDEAARAWDRAEAIRAKAHTPDSRLPELRKKLEGVAKFRRDAELHEGTAL